MLKKFDRIAIVFAAIIFLHLSLNSLLSKHWLSDLSNHFRAAEMIVFFITIGWICFRKSWKLGLTLSLLLGGGYWTTTFYQNAVGTDPYALASVVSFQPVDVGVQVISFNVYTANKRYGDVAKWIESTLSKDKVNLVFLMETNQEWITGLNSLKKRLPYKIESPREDNFGLALYSDTPLNDISLKYFDSNKLPAIWGHIKNKKIRIAGVHPLPPVGKSGFEARNQYFQNLRTALDEEKIPTLVFGDLNCSPWSKNIETVTVNKSDTEELHLYDSFRGLFRPHTWRALQGFVSTPIDYILYTPHFLLKSARMGPDLGSDHLPVVASF